MSIATEYFYMNLTIVVFVILLTVMVLLVSSHFWKDMSSCRRLTQKFYQKLVVRNRGSCSAESNLEANRRSCCSLEFRMKEIRKNSQSHGQKQNKKPFAGICTPCRIQKEIYRSRNPGLYVRLANEISQEYEKNVNRASKNSTRKTSLRSSKTTANRSRKSSRILVLNQHLYHNSPLMKNKHVRSSSIINNEQTQLLRKQDNDPEYQKFLDRRLSIVLPDGQEVGHNAVHNNNNANFKDQKNMTLQNCAPSPRITINPTTFHKTGENMFNADLLASRKTTVPDSAVQTGPTSNNNNNNDDENSKDGETDNDGGNYLTNLRFQEDLEAELEDESGQSCTDSDLDAEEFDVEAMEEDFMMEHQDSLDDDIGWGFLGQLVWF